MAPSKFVPTIQEGFTSYAGNWSIASVGYTYLMVKGVWQHRDETGNFLQKHDVEIVKEEKRFVLCVRACVCECVGVCVHVCLHACECVCACVLACM